MIDRWENQAAIDKHHESPMMAEIAALREKYDLHMKVERFSNTADPLKNDGFIRK